jgi:hypothetical protein
MKTSAMVGAAFVCCLATGASAAEVIQKGTVNAPVDKVWATIGDFCGVKNWIAIVTKCEISRKDDSTIYRTITLNNGGVIMEKLLAWDGDHHSYSYAIVDSPLPVQGYKSTLKVEGSGATSEIVWTGNFQPKEVSEDEAKKVISGIYAAGIDAIKAKVGGS